MKGGIVVVLLCAVLTAGCVSVGTDALRDEQTLAQIKVGETTKEQVLALLGPPSEARVSTLRGTSHEWWGYTQAESVINPLEYLLLVGLFFNGFGLHDTERSLHVSFDPDGKVSSLTRLTTDYDMGGMFSPLEVTSRSASLLVLPDRREAPISYESRMEARHP
jgi:hypothetical protein